MALHYSCETCGRPRRPPHMRRPPKPPRLCEDCAEEEHQRLAALEGEAVDRWIDERGEEG